MKLLNQMFNQSFNQAFLGGSPMETILDECKICFSNNIYIICCISGNRCVGWRDFTVVYCSTQCFSTVDLRMYAMLLPQGVEVVMEEFSW